LCQKHKKPTKRTFFDNHPTGGGRNGTNAAFSDSRRTTAAGAPGPHKENR